MPLNPEQYLPGQLKQDQPGAQPETPSETPPATPPAAPAQRSEGAKPAEVASSSAPYSAGPRHDLDQLFKSASGSRD
jgi:hypothetical protein